MFGGWFVEGLRGLVWARAFNNFSIGTVKEIINLGLITRLNFLAGFMLQSFPDFNVEMYILEKFHKSNILGKVSAYLQPYAEERDFSHFNVRIYIYELDERTLTLATDLSLFLTKA